MQRSQKSQCMKVLRYIEQFGSITSLEAFEDLRVTRLSARIKDLKQLGYPIFSKTEHYFHDGVYTHYARYFLEK